MFRFLSLLIFFLSSFYVVAQNNVFTSKVVDCKTKVVLKACIIEVVETKETLLSDERGEFTCKNLTNGIYTIIISKEGYEEKTLSIAINDSSEINQTIELCKTDFQSIDNVVVTASRINRKLKDEPITVQVIDAKRIENSQLPSLSDFLAQEMAGVDFNNNGGYSNINMLGFGGKYVLFLVDGERLAGETFDNIDYNRIDINNIERIEIIKGASSSLYGSNAIGGVINIITKKSTSPLDIVASGQYGSFNNQNHTLSIGTKQKWGSIKASGFFKMIDPYLLEDTEPLRQDYGNGKIVEQPLKKTYIAGFMNYGVSPKISFNITKKVNNEVFADYYFQERNTGGYEGYKIRDQFHNIRVGLKSAIDIHPNHHLSISASVDDFQKFKYYKLIEQTERNYDNLIWRVSTIYDHKFLKRHSNIVGAEVYSEQLLSFMFVSDGASTKKNAQNYSVFAQQEWALSEKVTLVSGIRFDYHSQFKGFPTFRLSTMYKINPYITLRGGYSGGFRSPTLKELYTDWFHPYGGGFQIIGNRNMKAEKSHNFNLSTDFSYKRLDITLMGQYSYINKKIDLFWLSNDTIQYQNSGNANVTSAELSIAYRFKFNLKLAASYSYVVQLPAKKSIVRPHNVTFTADYTPKFIKKYAPTLSINGKFYSSMTIFGTVDLTDDKNTTGVDSNTEEYRINYEPYMIWRLTLSVPLPFHFVLGAGINNLFNYRTKFSSFYSNTTPGRTYYVSLKWNFNLKNKKS